MIPLHTILRGSVSQRLTHRFGRVVRRLRLTGFVIGSLVMCGCGSVSQYQMRQAQLQTMQQYNQTQQALAQVGQAQQATAELGGQLAQLQGTNSQLQGELALAQQNAEVSNQRLANLTNERGQLHERYKNLLTGMNTQQNPLGGAANKQFEELARRFPDFEFDPHSGVAKFNGDLLFASGSDELRQDAHKLLAEFVSIMNSPEAKPFHIVVVGHTDDRPIVKAATKHHHETNWDLSVHRSAAVVKSLEKMGMAGYRMAASGYSLHRPTTANVSDSNRQRNRRVEIFVTPADAMPGA